MNISAKIKQLRAEKEITQEVLADKLHVSRTLISSWETGRSYPDLQTIVEISDYFEVSLEYLLREDHNMIKQLTFDTKEKKNYKKLKIIVVCIIIILLISLSGILYLWQGQLTSMNPKKIQIEKVEKIAIPSRKIDGKTINKDYKYYVYLKMNDAFHDYDIVRNGGNNYNNKHDVVVGFQVKNSINIFQNIANKNEIKKFEIDSFAAQGLVNDSKEDPYNIGKNIYLVGESSNNKKLIISSSDNK